MVKTFIRRPGNKTAHLKHIIPLIPKFTGTYYEPFLGTGAVYLHILPEKSVLNDINKDIINIWRLVRDDPDYIISEINKFKKKFLPLPNEDKLKMCKGIVSKMDTYKGYKRTVMYLLMVYCSLAGVIINNNSEWHINALYNPIYNNRSVHIFSDEYQKKIIYMSSVLKKVKIYNKDYRSLLAETKKGDFVFLDPPYIEKQKYKFVYNKNEIFDVKFLKDQLKSLDRRDVKWMMTQIDTPVIRNLFKEYRFNSYKSKRPFTKGVVSKRELIIMNY